MPKISKGLEYFNIDTDVNSDMRVKLLRAEFGIKGFGIWVQLLIQIYADEGYFMKWDNDTKLLFASDVGESGGLVDEVVKGSVKRGLFDESVFNQFSVLTSKHIQEKYFDAIKRRTSEVPIIKEYLVIPKNADIITDNVNIKELNADKKIQSRVEESRGEESNDNSDEKIDYKSFVDHWNECNNANCRITDKKRKQIRARLRTYTKEELLLAVENRSRDEWINGEGIEHKKQWNTFWRNDEKPERYLQKETSNSNMEVELW